MPNETKVTPLPEGYDSWLEYAVVTFDTRGAELLWLFDDKVSVSRDEIKSALWADFNALRQRAGLPPKNPEDRHKR